MVHHNEDFHELIRTRIRNWLATKGKGHHYADYLLFGPDLFQLLSRLVLDERIGVNHKPKLATAIAYFVSPVDLVPEAILGPEGYIDDIALAAYVLEQLMQSGQGDLASELWNGEDELRLVVERVLEVAESAMGTRDWERLRLIADKGWSSDRK